MHAVEEEMVKVGDVLKQCATSETKVKSRVCIRFEKKPYKTYSGFSAILSEM